MHTLFRPTLAATCKDINAVKIPVLGSAKVDGMRCIIRDGKPVSRTLTLIPNRFIQQEIAQYPALEGLDGELIVGPPNSPNLMQTTLSACTTLTGEPGFRFLVFDYVPEDLTIPFSERYKRLEERFHQYGDNYPFMELLRHTELQSIAEIEEMENTLLLDKYEGLMLRSLNGPYKFGRATEREGFLLKLKRFTDAEARIVGFEELMRNDNPKTIDARGYAKRSNHIANHTPMGTLGKLVVEDVETKIIFSVGSGLNARLRRQIWDNQDVYLGQYITYKHFKVTGVKDAPRLPIFKSLRPRLDIILPGTDT